MRQPGMDGRSSAKSPERIARSGASGRRARLSGPFARFTEPQIGPAGARPDAASASNTSTSTSFLCGLTEQRNAERIDCRRRRRAWPSRTAAIEHAPSRSRGRAQSRSGADRRAARGSRSSSRARPGERACPCSMRPQKRRKLGSRLGGPTQGSASHQHPPSMVTQRATPGAHVLDGLDAPRIKIGQQRQLERRVRAATSGRPRALHISSIPREEARMRSVSRSSERESHLPVTESRREARRRVRLRASSCHLEGPITAARAPARGAAATSAVAARCRSLCWRSPARSSSVPSSGQIKDPSGCPRARPAAGT